MAVGRGSLSDNVFVERFWRSIKYGKIHLHACNSLHAVGSRYIAIYNASLPHSPLGDRTTGVF